MTAQITQTPAFGGGGAPTPSVPIIVQQGVAADSGGDGVTLGAAPTEGNLLLAFFGQNLNPSVASGWTLIASSNAGTDYGVIAYKIAGASESATQNPASGTGAGGCAIFEINNGGYSFNGIVDANSATPAVTVTTSRAGGIIVGAFERADTTAQTAIVGATKLSHAEANGRGITSFSQLAPVDGANTITGTYGSTAADSKAMAAAVY